MPGATRLGHLSGQDHRTAIVEGLDEVTLLDAPRGGVLGVQAHDPVVVRHDRLRCTRWSVISSIQLSLPSS